MRVSRDGNPFYPLPRDYPDLSKEGQRLARVAGVSRTDTPEQFVESWALFRELYLIPCETVTFYRKGFLESPPSHYEWVRDFWTYDRCMLAAPRATAKSTVLGREVPLWLSLALKFGVGYLVLANDKMVEERIGEIMQQFERNELILADFGRQKPPGRSASIWNRHMLQLNNGAQLQGVSVESRKRGARPQWIIMDDPEYDPKKSIDETSMMKELESLLFRQLLPMLDPDCRISWIGTMLSRRSALWHACMSSDPRFDVWNRRVYAMSSRDEQGNVSYFWEGKFGEKEISKKVKELGRAAAEAELNNNPISSSDFVLHIEDPEDLYVIEGGMVRWKAKGPDGAYEDFEKPYDEWLNGLARIFTVDAAPTEETSSPTSDPSGILVTGIDDQRTWWILDLFIGRVMDTQLKAEIWRLGQIYEPALIGVESINFQAVLRRSIESFLEDETAGTSWQPRVFPIKYPARLSKSGRIMSLSSKMARHSIRFPGHLRDVGAMRQMFSQVNDFTPDLVLLPHDEAVDCLAMVPYCPRITPIAMSRMRDTDSLVSQILSGRKTDKETGLPLSLFIDTRTLDPGVIEELRWKKRKQSEQRSARLTARNPLTKLRRWPSRLTNPYSRRKG